MIVIGEKINATRSRVGQALKDRDEAAIAALAVEQVRCGAHYIDVNGADPNGEREAANLAWLVDVVRRATEAGISVDSANPAAAGPAMDRAGTKPIVNSISLEADRLEAMLPVVAGHDCLVVGLLMSDEGVPRTVEDRIDRAARLIDKLTTAGGRAIDEIIIDPCFFPLAADIEAVAAALASISAIRSRWPEVHICGGVSNTSHGLPQRRYVNLAVIVQAIAAGMDYGIIDPCVPGTMGLIYAAEALAGRDEFCMNYITAARAGQLT